MNFYYKTNKNIKHAEAELIDINIHRLFNKLKNCDFKNSGVSDYNQKYLNDHLNDIKKSAWFLSHIFLLLLEQGKSLSELTIVDYGGGSGLVSYLAKSLGVGTVIYNDIYDVSCNDVKIISDTLSFGIDHIVYGDINRVVDFLNDEKIEVDYIISQDVIEHIYDVERWFKKLTEINARHFKVVCTSHANLYNLLISTKLMKLHQNLELNSRNKEWGAKDRDSLESYFKIRRKEIALLMPDAESNILDKLAYNTRGLIIDDIKKQIERYKTDGVLHYKAIHKTNTCDPNTGNWAEQLIDLKKLNKELLQLGYSSKITPGFYISNKGNTIIRSLKRIVNHIIHYSGFKGLKLAPYYVLISELK